MKVAVVTPSIGSEHALQCFRSIQDQTYQNITHYIFMDGESYFDKILKTISNTPVRRPIKTIPMQQNVGKGWYGHRVYAACSFLVNADVICYLDEDNWYDPTHIENMVRELNRDILGHILCGKYMMLNQTIF
jgi:glycosyltransferase involved in cell wall biosynthesis